MRKLSNWLKRSCHADLSLWGLQVENNASLFSSTRLTDRRQALNHHKPEIRMCPPGTVDHHVPHTWAQNAVGGFSAKAGLEKSIFVASAANARKYLYLVYEENGDGDCLRHGRDAPSLWRSAEVWSSPGTAIAGKTKYRIPNFLTDPSCSQVWEGVVRLVSHYVSSVAEEAGPDTPIVIGFPGPIDQKGKILAAPTIVGHRPVISGFSSSRSICDPPFDISVE